VEAQEAWIKYPSCIYETPVGSSKESGARLISVIRGGGFRSISSLPGPLTGIYSSAPPAMFFLSSSMPQNKTTCYLSSVQHETDNLPDQFGKINI